MKSFPFAKLALVLGLLGIPGSAALAHDHVRLSFGFGCCGYYGPSYPYYPPPVYYAQSAPPVVYVTPPQQTIYVMPSVMPANQTSQTYVDDLGRSCRHFQSTVDGAPLFGVACLEQDGIWRTVE